MAAIVELPSISKKHFNAGAVDWTVKVTARGLSMVELVE
jgi:hypothetical protein